MSTFEAVKVIGIDDSRRPRIRKESYIDLFFKLSCKTPLDWCEDFNAVGRKLSPEAKMDKEGRDCIETYVNDMENIAPQLKRIQDKVEEINLQYLERIRQQELALAASNADLQGQSGEQNRLNQIVDALNFGD